MKQYDVVAVGGGPAGASAAWKAGQRGADALVVEKGVPREDRDELGPDSTDAAGMLNYWFDLIGEDIGLFENHVVRYIDDAIFHSPRSRAVIDGPITRFEDLFFALPRSPGATADTGFDAFGMMFDRKGMDDKLLRLAREAGADYRCGVSVEAVRTRFEGTTRHEIQLDNGESIRAEYVVLADGPSRNVTWDTLRQFVGEDELRTRIDISDANHVASQQYRRFPHELFEELKTSYSLFWGYIPGETAYPWFFPAEDERNIVRTGLTRPIDLDVSEVENLGEYVLMTDGERTYPSANEIIERLLTEEFDDQYAVEDFPLVETKGKHEGTEHYPISSTRPVDSPTQYGIALAGGAMGATSAFHEGGYYLALRTGQLAGELAAQDRLDEYNERWKRELGHEIFGNIAFANVVSDFGPRDWDRAFESVIGSDDTSGPVPTDVDRMAAKAIYALKYGRQRAKTSENLVNRRLDSYYRRTFGTPSGLGAVSIREGEYTDSLEKHTHQSDDDEDRQDHVQARTRAA